MKKLLSIILAVLMIVATVPFALAADDGTPLTIDVANEADNLVNIGNGQEYYDEDGYILTGSNENAYISPYEGCTLTLDNLTADELNSLLEDETLNVILKGNNEIKYIGIYKEDYVFSAVDGGTLKAPSMHTSGNDGTVTVNSGNIILDNDNSIVTIGCGAFTINGGTVTASASNSITIASAVELNGGTLNVINTSSEYEAIFDDVIMNKGALLTVSSTNGLLIYDYCDILMADGLAEDNSFFVRYDKTSAFVPVQDIKAALDGKTYAEIKIDSHSHSFTNSICICGYVCTHENFADGECSDCGVTGKMVTITMNDSYGDGWNGNAVIIKQLVDGEYEEIATATFDDGESYTSTTVLSAEDVYALTWNVGNYSYECSFTAAVDGETVFETNSCSSYEDGKILYIICDHTYTNSVCTKCGEECDHDWSNKDGVCSVCTYTCPHDNYTKGICDVCNYICFHSFTVFTETVAPKCEETGWEESYCDNGCGIKLEQEIPALEHDWVSGGIERPTQNPDGSWNDGYYYDTCKNDATHINKTGVAKRADYTAYDEAYKALKAEKNNTALTDAGAASVNQAVMTGMTMPQNIVEGENTAAYLNNWVKNAQSIHAKIQSGEYVKADYTEIDEAIKAVDEVLENATISDEMANELADIKADLEALKENVDATMADVNELLDRAEAITEIMNNCANGVHSFTDYAEVTAPKCGVAGKEVAVCDNGCGATDEREIPALEHKEHEDYSYGNTEHWKDCYYGCGTEIAGTRELHTYTWEVIIEATETTAGAEKGICACGWYDIREIPATGETPDEPTDDTCDHLCHKSGFLGFIWKIVRFFQKLFKINPICECGVAHY